ncbi:MAG: sigma-70 family RNA polymerase sigma factor [Spirochaetales bacterium]|nr:sigma-70 family RNA polymerase sigma factor [Spirochaetales bacterium]
MKRMDTGEIILAYEKKIRQFFFKNTYNRDDVDDLVQETICQIITSVHSFSGKSHVSTWIYSICKHVLYSYICQREKQKKIIKKINQLKSCSLHDFQSDIELKLLIDSLSDRDKLLFNLFYKKRYSIKEIAGLLHKPPGTVKYYLFRLRSEIKRYMKE